MASPVCPPRAQLSVRVGALVLGLVCGALALAFGACEPLPPPPTYSGQHPAHARRARAFEPMTGVEYENRFEARVYEMMQSPACAEAPVYALIDEEPPASVGGTSLGFCDGLMVRLLESGGSEVWGMGPASGSPAGWESRAFALGSLWVRTELPHGVEVRTVEGDGGVRLVRRGGFDLRVLPANAEDVAGALTAPAGCAVEVSGRRFLFCREGRRYRVLGRIELGGQAFVVESAPGLHASLAQAGEMVRAAQLMNADTRTPDRRR